METSLLQKENASMPILVTLLGIVIEVRASHALNASSPILVTPLGIVIEVIAPHPLNILQPILVILSDSSIEVKPSQDSNVPFASASA
jgi:hypothetical protein